GFQVVRKGNDFFKFFTFGSPLTVGIQVKNNAAVLRHYSVADIIPEELSNTLQTVEFMTPPAQIDSVNHVVRWTFALGPGQSTLLLYKIDAPTINVQDELVLPEATLTDE